MTRPKIQFVADSKDLHVLEDGSKSVVTIENFEVLGFAGNDPLVEIDGQAKATAPAEDTESDNGEKWVHWGSSDDFPEELLKKLSKLGVVKTALETNADMHYGAGIVFVKDRLENGKVIHDVVEIPEWREFCRNSNFLVEHGDGILSLETFYVAFYEWILDKNTKKPLSIKVLDTPRCRFAHRNSAGRVAEIYYNVHSSVPSKDIKPIKAYNPASPTKYDRFVQAVGYRTFGNIYYPEPNYYATFRAGWADTAIKIASFMKNVYTNMISIVYHIKIPASNLRAMYKDWDSLTQKEQLKLIEQYKTNIDDRLASAENAGKSVYSVFEDGEETVTIEPIKNYLDSSRELPTNVAANSEMLFALGTDPALVGLNNPGSGGDLNGSGGSDKRESRKNSQGNLKREREVSLQVVNLWLKLMDIKSNIYPMYMDTDTSQTMDENPTGKQNVLT